MSDKTELDKTIERIKMQLEWLIAARDLAKEVRENGNAHLTTTEGNSDS